MAQNNSAFIIVASWFDFKNWACYSAVSWTFCHAEARWTEFAATSLCWPILQPWALWQNGVRSDQQWWDSWQTRGALGARKIISCLTSTRPMSLQWTLGDPITIYGIPVEQVFIYIFVHITEDLTWATHTEAMVKFTINFSFTDAWVCIPQHPQIILQLHHWEHHA